MIEFLPLADVASLRLQRQTDRERNEVVSAAEAEAGVVAKKRGRRRVEAGLAHEITGFADLTGRICK